MLKRLFALIAALVVPYLLFVFVIGLNQSDFDPAEEAKKVLNFDVEKRAQIEKPKPKPKKQEQKRQRSDALPSVRPSNIGSDVGGSGLSFGVPQFDEADFAEFQDGGLLDSEENRTMDDSSVDTPPKIRRRSPIVYPEQARRQGISGYVSMNVLIDENGRVEDVQILDSKPKEIFDLKAESTIRLWKFEPATYNGQKVKVWATQKIVFKLQ